MTELRIRHLAVAALTLVLCAPASLWAQSSPEPASHCVGHGHNVYGHNVYGHDASGHAGHGFAPDPEAAFGVADDTYPGLVEGATESRKKGKKGKKGKGGDPKEDEADDTSWDVNDPPLERYTVDIDVDEGTWLNLDVSPDGQDVIFDLLGDLYRVPMEGGDAEAITSGLAWDMQPRYSPDGEWIAFTSDRAGGDNIWIMKRDGSEPTQITKESFRLLNSPAWSPDGQWIAARKHFTSRRSLGAGEIWLYHRSGGGGLQLNEKPNEQKDLGEPIFSPDGRYIYFSRDTTPGSTFQYNKDSNGEIYTVRRLDRETGEIEPYITGPGGAVRPTPSPDGKYIAFVRRVRFQSALFLHDMVTGENRMLFDGLERDMQETWAIHGVYPSMAWTPDSQSVVFWAQGKLWRHALDGDAPVEIPFRVRQTHEMVEAVRHTVDVAPETVDVKMLRWVQVSPGGDQVVFQALGKLWLRSLPDGEPQRLTTQDDHSELYPAFSRDGQSIVYTTWDDRALGAVRIAAARPGSTGRVVTPEPGHYYEPALSPDGSTVVYRKGGGGFLTSPLYSKEPGLYALSLDDGSAPRRIQRSGFRPHFGASDDRVYFQTFLPKNRRALESLSLAGRTVGERQARTHYESDAATEMRVSPDGQWLAFTERFNAHITPFVAASKAIQLGPKTSSVPLAKVTRDAGEYLHWSDDSQTLYWALGPKLFERPLTDAFAFLDGAPEELPEPPSKGRAIGFSLDADIPSGTVALVGGRLITMRGDEIIEHGTVVVEGNRIVAVGETSAVEVPEGAHVVDVKGKTLMPGLVDVHWHGAQGTQEIVPDENWFNLSSLAFGVTTIHDPSTDTSTFFAASEMARVGAITAPRLFSTGTILYGAAGDFKAIIDSLEDAEFHLRRLKAVGAFSVKSYNQPRRDQRQQVIKAAKDLEMMVLPEGGSLYMHNMTMVVDGHTGIEHSLPVANIYDDVIQLWSESRTGYTPTMGVAYGGIGGERYWYHHTDVWANERLLTFTPRQFVDPVARRRTMAPEEEYNHIPVAVGAKQLLDAGVLVQVGAHGQREGLATHWEMWMFEQGGMTPHEALRVGTLYGAQYLGLDGDIGSLEVGKLADLIVLEKNPLENLRDSEAISHTMINGRLYDARTLHQVGNHPAERGALFFEE